MSVAVSACWSVSWWLTCRTGCLEGRFRQGSTFTNPGGRPFAMPVSDRWRPYFSARSGTNVTRTLVRVRQEPPSPYLAPQRIYRSFPSLTSLPTSPGGCGSSSLLIYNFVRRFFLLDEDALCVIFVPSIFAPRVTSKACWVLLTTRSSTAMVTLRVIQTVR
jgi:hypothetical protein